MDLALHSEQGPSLAGAGASLCGSGTTHRAGPGKAGSTSSLDGMFFCVGSKGLGTMIKQLPRRSGWKLSLRA